MITGTCNFISKQAAYKYYSIYGCNRAAVDEKIANKEIEIGQPPLKQGQRSYVGDEGRYFIEGAP